MSGATKSTSEPGPPEVVKPSPIQIAARKAAEGKKHHESLATPANHKPRAEGKQVPVSIPKSCTPKKKGAKHPGARLPKSENQQRPQGPSHSGKKERSKLSSSLALMLIGIVIILVMAVFVNEQQPRSQDVTVNLKSNAATEFSATEAKNDERPSPQTARTIDRPGDHYIGKESKSSTLPQTYGAISIAASTGTSRGKEFLMSNDVRVLLQRDSSTITDMTGRLPIVFTNIPRGNYSVSLYAKGFNGALSKNVFVNADARASVDFTLIPANSKARFIFPDGTNVVFNIFSDKGDLVGDSRSVMELVSFEDYYLTFSAAGWRKMRYRVCLPFTDGIHTIPIRVQRLQSGIMISLKTEKGPVPQSGMLRLNDNRPFAINFPYEHNALPFAGDLTLNLTVDGYHILDNPRAIKLEDNKKTNVVFNLKKKAWYE